MRSLTLIAPLALAAALSACAGTAGPAGTYSQQEQALAADCRARGGILVPRDGQMTGRPQADNVCKITGVTSRIDED